MTDIKGVDAATLEIIERDIVDNSPGVRWDDIGETLMSSMPLPHLSLIVSEGRGL